MRRYLLPATLVLAGFLLWRWHTQRPVTEAYRRAVAGFGGESWTFLRT
ncbi:hypothetical protein [Oceanithermus sp.]|nr:hypothetical protein [Oceanithermus sp.]